MTNKLTKLAKVNENISINRYDNGWMVEVGGRNEENDCRRGRGAVAAHAAAARRPAGHARLTADALHLQRGRRSNHQGAAAGR